MKTFDKNASAARFLLGGIGTGNISLDQNARLCDFEIWNKPNKGFRSPYTFFAVRTENPDGDVRIKALESQLAPPFNYSHGANVTDLGGLPRFRESGMTGNYPFVSFTLSDKNMPVEAGIEAFTPLIPLNADDSSLPAAILRYVIKNISGSPLTVSVAGSMANLCHYKTVNGGAGSQFDGKGVNRYVDQGNIRGIHFLPSDKTEAAPDYLEAALLTTEKAGVSHIEYWNEGAWWDGLQDFWNDFSADGELTCGRELRGKGGRLHASPISVASLCIKKEISAGESSVFEFVISWYHPNRIWSWDQNAPVCDCADPASCGGDCGCDSGADAGPASCCDTGSDCGAGADFASCCDAALDGGGSGPDPSPAPAGRATIRNYYAKFGPPLKTAAYLVDNLERLESLSRKFADALMSGTMPEYALDAVSANITVIRSNTCFRVEDGSFFGWEGCSDFVGCCDGNCTHVWNYTQTLAFLFPELERSMRRTEFLYETEDDGRMYFRAYHYLNDPEHTLPPAADGQLGTVVRLYRDWKLCGDDAFIREMWPKAKLALEYAFTHWDIDGDGIMEGEQHNTYDIEFYGMSSMLNSIFYAALRAGEEISAYLGNAADAEKYAQIRRKGAQKLDELTFNGEFYTQLISDVNEYKYQYGAGCLADQLLGQYQAHVCGLGYVLDEKNVKSAMRSIYKYNFVEDFGDIVNLQRMYALNQNRGLLLCSWPNGGRPLIPFVYSDEVWTGFEYQVAAHLIYEGFAEEGLKIVEAARERHDGVERSPWNEVECGHHYARSLSSYAVLLALTGFRCDAVNKTLTFKPAINSDNFAGFFCCADGWGIYRRTDTANSGAAGGAVPAYSIETLYGDLSDYTIISE